MKLTMLGLKTIAYSVIFAISFLFYFLLLFLIKEEFFYAAIFVISVLYGISFVFAKKILSSGRIISIVSFILAVLLNLRLMGVL